MKFGYGPRPILQNFAIVVSDLFVKSHLNLVVCDLEGFWEALE